jgi:transcriptional regulator with XRE-family HTH domain
MKPPVENSTPPATNPEDGIGERLRTVREKHGLSQTLFHQRTKDRDPEGKGISRTVLIGYETGKFKPGARELRILCEAFSLTPEWLLLGVNAGGEQDIETAKAMLAAGLGTPGLADVFRLALIFVNLKHHEREALGTLAHGLVSARRGVPSVDALTHLAGLMAMDAELRLTELTEDRDAAVDLRSFKGKKLIEHFSNLYEAAYEERFSRKSKDAGSLSKNKQMN